MKNSEFQLDLHGIKHEYAREATIRFLEDKIALNRKSRSTCNVGIVTGHSTSMREIVIDVLDMYGFTYYVGGYLGMNPAVITVEVD